MRVTSTYPSVSDASSPVGSKVVALAATAGRGRSLAPLLALLGHGHRMVSWHRGSGTRWSGRRVDVVVASDPEVLASVVDELEDRGLGSGVPPRLACWVETAAELDATVAMGSVVTFTGSAALAGTDGGRGADAVVVGPVLVPDPGIDVGRHPLVSPLTRARMREAYGLVDPLVVAVDDSAPDAVSSTSLALASAAVVGDELLPLALALGTPTVVTAAVAERFGLTDGDEVVVSASDHPSQADRLAARLARDEAACAALSRRARRFAEDRLDIGTPIRSLRRRLGLEAEPSLVTRRLDELATPGASRLRERGGDALAIFRDPTPARSTLEVR